MVPERKQDGNFLKPRSAARAMCGVQLKDRKRANDLMLGLNDTIDWLAMANSVCWYGDVLG